MPTNPAFDDCFDLLDSALAEPKGLRLTFPDFASASALRFRLHHARRINREDNKTIYAEEPAHPLFGKSEYDSLVCRIKPNSTSGFFLYIEKSLGPLAVESLSEIIDET